MITLVKRLVMELRTRGLLGFGRFLALRLLQWRADVLFELDLTPGADIGEQTGADMDLGLGFVLVVDRSNFGTPATAMVEQEVLSGANHAYVEELQGSGQLLALVDGQGHVSSYAFIVFDTFYKRILGEAGDTPIISNCLTLPAHRGQGLYPRLLRASCQRLAAQGHRRAIITCAPDNFSSISGIEKAGFRPVKTVCSLILFARWITLQRSHLSVPARLSEPAGASAAKIKDFEEYLP